MQQIHTTHELSCINTTNYLDPMVIILSPLYSLTSVFKGLSNQHPRCLSCMSTHFSSYCTNSIDFCVAYFKKEYLFISHTLHYHVVMPKFTFILGFSVLVCYYCSKVWDHLISNKCCLCSSKLHDRFHRNVS